MKDGQTIGQWLKWDFKTNGNLVIKDKKRRTIYLEDSSAFWARSEYDSQEKEIYGENSNGKIIDNRIPEVIEHNGRKYKLMP